MCVSWKNTLIRIINELWGEEWGVAEQTRILLVRNSATHCQSALAIKSPNWSGSLMKTNILCNPQGGNDYNWGRPGGVSLTSQRKVLSLETQTLSLLRKPGKSSGPKGPFLQCVMWGLALLDIEVGWEEMFVMKCISHLSPPPLFSRFSPFKCKNSKKSALRKKTVLGFPTAHKKKYCPTSHQEIQQRHWEKTH